MDLSFCESIWLYYLSHILSLSSAQHTHGRTSIYITNLDPPFIKTSLDVEQLLQDAHGVLGALDRVADGPGVAVDLEVVAALKGLVAEEVDVLVGDSVGLLGLVLEVLQAVGLVPAGGEDVEGDLATDGEAN